MNTHIIMTLINGPIKDYIEGRCNKQSLIQRINSAYQTNFSINDFSFLDKLQNRNIESVGGKNSKNVLLG